MTEIIAKLEPSLGRRWVGVVALTVAGVALIAIVLLRPPSSALVQVVAILLGGLFLWQAQWNLRVTRLGLYVTRQGIYDSEGQMIVALSDIEEVDRGIFAFKPSNGFLLRLFHPEQARWAPGLYWRIGRRMGVGGATNPAQTRKLAETIEMLLMERTLGAE